MRIGTLLACVVAFAAALLLAARKTGERRPWGGLPPALGCADLGSDTTRPSSFSGSHSALDTGAREVGIGRMLWRQFSDWKAAAGADGAPLFAPVLALDETGLGAKSVHGYAWRPDAVRFRVEYAAGLRAAVTAGYLGIDALFAQVEVTNAGQAPRRVVFSGNVSPHAAAVISASPDPRVLSIQIEAAPPNAWGTPPTLLQRRFELQASLGTLRATGERGYEAAFDLPAGETQRFAVTITDGLAAGAARRFWADPRRPPALAAQAVDAWLREASIPRPPAIDAAAMTLAYKAWHNFWQNTQHAEGRWQAPVVTPDKSSHGRGVGLWDSALHAMALAGGGPAAVHLAEDQVLAFVRNAHPDGRLPREVWVGAADPEIPAPGVLTWAALAVYRRTHRRGFLEEAYPVFVSNNRWYYARRDDNHNGLAEWTGGGSGWDASARWDAAQEGGRPLAVDAVDLNCWLKLDQDCLAEMADLLGRPAEAADWRARAGRTAALIRERMWDGADGFYYDLHPKTGEKIRVRTPHTYWAMLARVATPAEAARMAAHLADPDAFATPWPMPSVAKDAKAFRPKDDGRGAVRVALNWLTIRGLENYGCRDEARRLRRRTIEMIARDPVPNAPHAGYNPITGEGLGTDNDVGTGALLLVLLGDEAR